ncbi:hypothetical protein D3C81_1761760 [compost metagenome]
MTVPGGRPEYHRRDAGSAKMDCACVGAAVAEHIFLQRNALSQSHLLNESGELRRGNV